MDFSKIRLIVSDMDGTLLDSRSRVSPEFFQIFSSLQEKNIQFAVASGRQYFSLMERMEPIKEALFYIAENGALVMHGGQVQYSCPMDPDKVRGVIEAVRQIGGKHLVVCTKDYAYIEDTDPAFMEAFRKHYERYRVVDDVLQVHQEILKITLCDLSGAEEHSYPQVKGFEKELQVKLSGKIWIDFTHREAHKGNALRFLQDKLHISKEETIAFGDYLNDVELFEHAALGYAVANAHPDVKKAAEFSTKSNDENGVELILQRIADYRSQTS